MDSSRHYSAPTKAPIIVAVIILSTLLASQASLNQSIIIHNSGAIIAMQSVGVNSQMRGIYINDFTNGLPFNGGVVNWTTVAANCATYGINMVDLSTTANYLEAYPSVVVSGGTLNFTAAIAAFHKVGIRVYAHFSTMYKGGPGDAYDCLYLPSGSLTPTPYYTNFGWLDISNSAAIQVVHNIVNELVSNYSIDGIVFDYTRWDDMMPVSTASFAQFKSDTGLDTGVSYSTWLSDIADSSHGGNGKYNIQFYEWRTNLVTTFVKNITQWAHAINPNLIFGCSPHSLYQGFGPAFWRYNQGQDVAYWISQGYVQWIAPMMYESDTAGIIGDVQADEQYMTGNAHGIVPICPFICRWPQGTSAAMTTSNYVAVINAIKSAGGDGWIEWGYSGGINQDDNGYLPDLIPYFTALGLPNPQTFAMGPVSTTTINSTAEQISWTTTNTANSTVEYSSSPLYTWAFVYDSQTSFNYWQCTYVAGTIVTNTTLSTYHAIIISYTSVPLYFHIMSGGPSGIAFVYKFSTGG